MTEEVARVRFDVESNISTAKTEFDSFKQGVRDSLDIFDTFTHEASSYGDGLALALEKPKVSLGNFVALFNVGMESVKSGGKGAVTGISTIGMALANITERIGPLNRFTPVFNGISSAASGLSGILNRMAKTDMSRVMDMTSRLGETLAAQGQQMKQIFQQEVTGLRQAISELNKRKALYEKTLEEQRKIMEASREEIPIRRQNLELLEKQVSFAKERAGRAESSIEEARLQVSLAETAQQRGQAQRQLENATLRYKSS